MTNTYTIQIGAESFQARSLRSAHLGIGARYTEHAEGTPIVIKLAGAVVQTGTILAHGWASADLIVTPPPAA